MISEQRQVREHIDIDRFGAGEIEQIQRGLQCLEDEWVYMHRGLGIPGRVRTHDDGTITAPATDEVFMREYIKEWKRLMKTRPNLAIQREP